MSPGFRVLGLGGFVFWILALGFMASGLRLRGFGLRVY